jgi:hypothetical protein
MMAIHLCNRTDNALAEQSSMRSGAHLRICGYGESYPTRLLHDEPRIDTVTLNYRYREKINHNTVLVWTSIVSV